MATEETTPEICLVCLSAPVVRQLDSCRHSYCENCLSSPNFVCPKCPTHESKSQVAGCPGAKLGGQDSTTPAAEEAALVDANCKLCHFKGKTMKATGFCKDCRKMPMCHDCLEAHRNNNLTQNHEVVPAHTIDTTDEEVPINCLVHDEPLALFCTTCSIYICHVCISLEHVDHEITDVVQTELENVTDAFKRENDWLDMLKSDERELEKMKTTAQELEAKLIKEIEYHGEKCIAEILKNKEALKKRVKSDFEVVRAMEKCLETMPELQKNSADAVTAAKKLLSEQAAPMPTYVEKLVTLKQQLGDLKESHPTYAKAKAKYLHSFNELVLKEITFYPRTPNCKIGGFQNLYAGPRCNVGGSCVCDTCEREVAKLPNKARVDECRRRGTCICGTCGCSFNRNTLTGYGCCSHKVYDYNSTYPRPCNTKITVDNSFDFP